MPERLTVDEAPYTIGIPPFRPGDKADFGGGFAEQPGDLNRPDVTCSAQDTATQAVGLIRVLDDAHVASGEWDPNLDEDTLLKGLEHMMLSLIHI